jgi:hypothetical protein
MNMNGKLPERFTRSMGHGTHSGMVSMVQNKIDRAKPTGFCKQCGVLLIAEIDGTITCLDCAK